MSNATSSCGSKEPGTYDPDCGSWFQFAMYVLLAFSIVLTVMVCITGNTITVRNDELSCSGNCAIRVFPGLVRRIRDAIRRIRGRGVAGLRKVPFHVAAFLCSLFAALIQLVTLPTMWCGSMDAGCNCEPVSDALTKALKEGLDDVLEALHQRADGARAALDGCAYEDKERLTREADAAEDLAQTCAEMCDAGLASMFEYLHDMQAHGRYISLSRLVVDFAMAAVRVPRFGDTMNMQALLKMDGALRGVIEFSHLQSALPSVWRRVRVKFLEDAPGAPARSNKVSAVLAKLVNQLVDFDPSDAKRVSLHPIHVLWLRLLVFYVALLVVFGSAGLVLRTFVAQSEKARNFYLFVGDNVWDAIMWLVVALLILVQILVTRWFLRRQRRMLERAMLISIEQALLTVLADADVLDLVRRMTDEIVDATISALVGNLTALRWPIEYAYAQWGGTDKVMQLVDWANREKVRPSVTQCFDQMLDQNDAERFRPTTAAPAAAPLSSTSTGGQLEQPGGDAGAPLSSIQVEDGNGRIQSRLDLVEDRFDDALVLLNKAVFKAVHAPAFGARALQQNHAARVMQRTLRRARRGDAGAGSSAFSGKSPLPKAAPSGKTKSLRSATPQYRV